MCKFCSKASECPRWCQASCCWLWVGLWPSTTALAGMRHRWDGARGIRHHHTRSLHSSASVVLHAWVCWWIIEYRLHAVNNMVQFAPQPHLAFLHSSNAPSTRRSSRRSMKPWSLHTHAWVTTARRHCSLLAITYVVVHACES